MTSNMQQYKRDQLYLPTANSNATPPKQLPGDYQSYKKESAFRRLVSGALRGPGGKQQRQPSASEYDTRRPTLTEPPPEPAPRARPEDDRERRRRSHRKSNYSEAPRPVPQDSYDDRRDVKRSHRKSMYGEVPRQAPADEPPVPPLPSKKSHRKSMYGELPRRTPADELLPTPKPNRRSMYRELPRQAQEDEPPLPAPKSHRKSMYGEVPRQPSDKSYDYRRPPPDERRFSRRGELKPLSSNPVVTPVNEPEGYVSVNPKAENRATVDARRPYTTERLSRASRRQSRRAE